jgi:hypothetical protein
LKKIIPECNQTVLKEAMGIFVGTKMENCLSTSVCETTKFTLSLSACAISFQDEEIENHHTRISYDIQPERIYNSHYGNGVPAMFTS